jgi:hypothetical protein
MSRLGLRWNSRASREIKSLPHAAHNPFSSINFSNFFSLKISLVTNLPSKKKLYVQ